MQILYNIEKIGNLDKGSSEFENVIKIVLNEYTKMWN